MSRTARLSKINIIIACVVMVALTISGLIWYTKNTGSDKQALSNTPAVVQPPQTTQLSYKGEDGKTALELLKLHAKVVTKSSSVGEYVVSINDNDGGGNKYWLFYVNGKEAVEGAATYQTHANEQIEWKLQ